MRSPHSVRLGPALVVLGAAFSAGLLFMVSPLSRGVAQADCSASSPCPTPTPTPTLAFLTLDVTSGDSNTQITVNGGAFLPNEQMTLYWDQTNKVAGGANADSSGNFVTHVRPFAGDPPGTHRLCASVPPFPCADFTIVEASSPSPSPSPSSSPAATPSAAPTEVASAAPTASPLSTNLNGFDVISKPPFVFLPIAGGLAILFALGYWVLSVTRRPKPLKIPATAVVHRASRPDYSAGFGAPPAAPAAAAPQASAWDDVPPRSAPEPHPPQPESAPAEPEAFAAGPPAETPPEPPAVDWDVPPPGAQPGPDEPPDLPEPGED